MFNFNNKKSKRMVSSVIILLLVLAMIIPTLAYLMPQSNEGKNEKVAILTSISD